MKKSTWARDRGCIAWCARIPTNSLSTATMAGLARRLIRLLPGFAVPYSASWTICTAGADTIVYDRGSAIDDDTITLPFQAHPDVSGITMGLDLILTTPDQVNDGRILDGATLTLEHCDDELVLNLSLNVDVYARHTKATNYDNRVLARLNSWRLSTFLARTRAHIRVPFQLITSEPRYLHQVTQHGFRAIHDAS